MKYKAGDTVKLKSKEELMKLGTWYEPCAEVCGGKSYKIEEFVENSYRSENTTFDEESIECLVSEAEMQKQEATYTFEELKSEVEKFREYLLNAGNKNGCCIDVSFSSTKYEGLNAVANVKSDISIKFNGITIETD